MRKHRVLQTTLIRKRDTSILLLLCICFIAGAIFAWLMCKFCGTDPELKEYLAQYSAVLSDGGAMASASIIGVFAAYFRLPCLVFIFGFWGIAVWLFAIAFLFEGFLLTFAICSISTALGNAGVWISLCVFGLRFLLILPISLFIVLLGQRRRVKKTAHHTGSKNPGNQSRLAFFCPIILLLGVMIEVTFVPKLLAKILQNLL